VVALEPDRLAYVEGAVDRNGWEPHAWAVDKATGAVEEVTSSYEGAARYRGLVLDFAKVELWLDPERRTRWKAPAGSAIWIALYEFYEGRTRAAELTRTLRQLTGRS